MHKIEKQILFELKKELKEDDFIPGEVLKSVAKMATADPNKKEDPPKEKALLQTRIKPFVYPVSLMVAKFRIFAKEAETASKEDGAQNVQQLKRKQKIFEAIREI